MSRTTKEQREECLNRGWQGRHAEYTASIKVHFVLDLLDDLAEAEHARDEALRSMGVMAEGYNKTREELMAQFAEARKALKEIADYPSHRSCSSITVARYALARLDSGEVKPQEHPTHQNAPGYWKT